MYICKVIGKVVATVKDDRLAGGSLIVVRRLDDKNNMTGPQMVAMDCIGCGPDNLVLVTEGSGARLACGRQDAPVDLAVVGILDQTNNIK